MVNTKRLSAAVRNIISNLICFCFLFAFTGCKMITSVHIYDGPPLSVDKIAKITVEDRKATGMDKLMSCYPSPILVVAVDDKDTKKYAKEEGYVIPLEVFVLPGLHTFGVKFYGPSCGTSGAIPALAVALAKEHKYGPLGTSLQFNTESGREYRIRFKEREKPWKGIVDVNYWVEDVNSGQVILGEIPPPPPPK